MRRYEKELLRFLNESDNWSSLSQKLSEHDYSGKIFEAFCKYYFENEPEVKDDYKEVLYFEDIDTDTRKRLGFINSDYGVDLLLKDIDDKLIAVQCKYRSNENIKLNWSADKLANLFGYATKADGFIIFTNAAEVDIVSKSKENFAFFNISYLLNIEKSTFHTIKAKLEKVEAPIILKKSPKPHQLQAINDCVDFFQIENKGQLIMPCGSGKTLTALWIKEKMKASNTLVLVPSLALLRQIKADWAKQRSSLYHYLCVCSEEDINKEDEEDGNKISIHEISGRVPTTEPTEIKRFLHSSFDKVIFSTYQSLPKIEQALRNSEFEFDLAFCDEAHKTAGVNHDGLFSIIHKKIRVKKKLYMTATPRILSESIKKKLDDDLKYAYDMSNPEIFGYEFYRMSFYDAIKNGILVDYKIVTVGITDVELQTLINERRFVDDSKSTIYEKANNYALEKVMQQFNATHAVTFHSKVKAASFFSERHTHIYPSFKTFHVNGSQTTSERTKIIKNFKDEPKAVISNARCLTEGVDVPAIDLVYFCDPKNSKVDIVQAIGRALRKNDDKNKKLGYIVIPIYHKSEEEIENVINDGHRFKNLINVVRALSDQDERLQDEINQLAFGEGKYSKFDRIEHISNTIFTENKINLIGFDEVLKQSLFNQIIEKTSNGWDLWFLKLKEYLQLTENEYPKLDEDPPLYRWIAKQRVAKGTKSLSIRQVNCLNSISFVWEDNQESSWNKKFEALKKYSEENDFEPSIETNRDLATWSTTQKQAIKKNTLSEERKIRFLSIKFKGSVIEAKWQKLYEGLITFRSTNPDKWPQYDRKDEKVNNELATFCQQRRKDYNNGVLSKVWIDKLEKIDFPFDSWEKRFEKFKAYIVKYKMLPKNEDSSYSWVRLQVAKYQDKSLSEKQIELLDSINFIDLYRKSIKKWDDWYEDVNAFYELAGCLPTAKSEKQLASWLANQRKKKNDLSQEQINKLDQFKIIWDGKENNDNIWNETFTKLKDFKINNSRFPLPSSSGEERKLYEFCQQQRQRQAGTASAGKTKALENWKVEMLESIDFIFNPRGEASLDEKWEDNYQNLKQLMISSPKIPTSIDGKTNPIYRWIVNQKKIFEKGELQPERVEKLKSIGIILDKKLSN